ncbi:hypothetical protein F5Y10DRAFT_261892 [Nemania abortiva]|nr:hypothetical protein F5Y10DRAFT_261892 [Nemania abortiva]
MINETIAISQSIENDPRHNYTLPYPSGLSDSDATPTLDFSWDHPAGDVGCHREPCFGRLEKGASDAHTGSWPYALANEGFSGGPRPGSGSIAPRPSAQEQTIEQSTVVNPLGTADLVPGRPYPDAEASPDRDLNRTRDRTSSELSQEDTGSVRRTTSLSPTASVDRGVAPDINNHHREKNRVAARKCRLRAKQHNAGLQQRERELRRENRRLLDQANGLRDEILNLKDEILRHSACDSSVIQNYIVAAAHRQMR